MTDTNGTNPGANLILPPDRALAFEAGLAQYHSIAADRDKLQQELTQVRSDLAACRVMVEAQQAQLNDASSRVASATLMRDQAIAERATWEALIKGIQATLAAFVPPGDPVPHPDDPR